MLSIGNNPIISKQNLITDSLVKIAYSYWSILTGKKMNGSKPFPLHHGLHFPWIEISLTSLFYY